jgi:hypothetical protein
MTSSTWGLGQATPPPEDPGLIAMMGVGSRALGYGLILAAFAILYFRTRGR